MPLRFRQRILDHLAHDQYRPSAQEAVTRDLRIAADDRPRFEQAITALEDEGLIEFDDRGRLRLPRAEGEVTGRIKVNVRGFGFVIPQKPIREGDLFIPPGNLADAVTGDLVKVAIHRRRGRYGGGGKDDRSVVGQVIEIIERGQAKFVGVLRHVDGQWRVEPDGTTLREPVLIRDPHAKNAKEGDKVAIELLHYPEQHYHAEGVITEVLGTAGKPSVETKAIITAHGLRQEFETEVIDEARAAARKFDEEIAEWDRAVGQKPSPRSSAKGRGKGKGKSSPPATLPTGEGRRDDLRDLYTITIDPPDAKDFDDAITIERDEDSKEWTLGVHIADVAHFVEHGSALDQEAYLRGNSVYLPRLVLPMLPEVLSNGVCSLQEDVPRFAKSAFMTFDHRGKVLSQRACSSVIRSVKRLTYLEAQALIDGDESEARKHARTEPKYDQRLIDTLRMMDELARTLRARRRRDGMIALNLPEVELIFDDEGHVKDVQPEDDAFTHTIIEMFMVEANEAVARLFSDLGVPVIRRIHPDPAVGKIDRLRSFAMIAGRKIPDVPTRKDLQGLLEATAKSPAARAIHFAVLRTLSKATYSPAMIGHYALASDHYTHFTSPIRRYPDLAVHRALQAFFDLTDNGRNVPGGRKRRKLGENLMHDARVLDEAQLIQLGRHCSDTEQNAEEAERELTDFLVMQYLKEHHMGGVFKGVVSGVSAAGVFVSLEQFLVEGLVRSEDLPTPNNKPERWRHAEHIGRLVAERSGASVGIGDAVEAQIVSIDLASRHMDLAITSMPMRPVGEIVEELKAGRSRGGPKGKHAGKRDGGGKHRKGFKRGRRGRKA